MFSRFWLLFYFSVAASLEMNDILKELSWPLKLKVLNEITEPEAKQKMAHAKVVFPSVNSPLYPTGSKNIGGGAENRPIKPTPENDELAPGNIEPSNVEPSPATGEPIPSMLPSLPTQTLPERRVGIQLLKAERRVNAEEQLPRADIRVYSEEQLPRAERRVNSEELLPRAERRVNSEAQLPRAERTVNSVEQLPGAEMRVNSEEQLPKAEMRVNSEEQLPRAERRVNSEELLPRAEKRVNSEEQLPRAEMTVNSEEQVPSAERRVNSEEHLPRAERRVNSEEQLPSAERRVKSEEQLPRAERRVNSEEQFPRAERRANGEEENDDKDMRLKLFRLMYETVRDSDLKVKRAELIKNHYTNSSSFEIGYLMGDLTDKSNIITDISTTLKRFHREWKPIEHINAYEQITNQAIEITHLIDLVRVVNKRDGAST